MRIIYALLCSAIVGLGAVACEAPAEAPRNVIVSDRFPPVEITIDETFEPVGVYEGVLYETADAQIHVYAKGAAGEAQRLYWIQFEGYLPEIDRTYDYSNSQRETPIGDHTYHDDFWIWDLRELEIEEGSDTGVVLDLLEEAGLTFGPQLVGLRLVRLDEAKRNELMIVYLEDIYASGLINLSPGTTPEEAIETFRTRAIEGLVIEEIAP